MRKPLRIFIIGPAFPLRGGPARFNENLCSELLKEGHDARIISYSMQYPSFLFPGSSQFEENGNAPSGMRIYTLINTINPFSWFRTAVFIRKERPDLILFRYWLPFFGPSLGTIARLVRKHTTVLALTDNVLPHEKRAGDRQLTRYFINGCHGFIAMSRKVLADISLFSPNATTAYAPHPMYATYGTPVSRDAARAKLRIGNDEKIVLFFGLIRHYKGLDILIRSMSHPAVRAQGIKLLIAGEFYEDKQPYLDLIESLDMQADVILHDRFIRDEDVKYYFCAGNIVAQTYRDATNSGVTMVGYYYDCPMLVSNVGGLAEIVPHNVCGYTVPLSEDAVSASLVDYFENNREPDFTANVQLEKRKYEWKSFIETLLNLYRSAHQARNPQVP